jgi:hypothetical protein
MEMAAAPSRDKTGARVLKGSIGWSRHLFCSFSTRIPADRSDHYRNGSVLRSLPPKRHMPCKGVAPLRRRSAAFLCRQPCNAAHHRRRLDGLRSTDRARHSARRRCPPAWPPQTCISISFAM